MSETREPRQDASADFAAFIAAASFDRLPPALVAATKHAILDTIAVILAGSGASAAIGVRHMVSAWGGHEQATLIGAEGRLPAVSAAFVNAAAAHQYDFDDTHDAAVVHPTANALTAALALAEAAGDVSGADLLAAIAHANEITCRLGLALTGNLFDYPWTRPPVLGTFGAAAAAARILKLAPGQIRSAFGLTLHQACNTLECLYAPASEVRGLRDGFSVRNGVTAALMAEQGIIGDVTAFEGRFGLFNAFFRGDYRPEMLTGGLGEHWEAANISIKPWPSARETHATIHAALELKREHDFAAEEVRDVLLTVGKPNLEFCEPGEQRRNPARRMDALSSLPFAVATALTRGRVTLQGYTDAAIRDPETLAMADRVRWQLDAGIDEGTIEGGRIRVTLADGRVLEGAARHGFGHPGEPLPAAVRRAKLDDCVAMMPRPLPPDRVQRIVDTVEALDTLPVSALTAALAA